MYVCTEPGSSRLNCDEGFLADYTGHHFAFIQAILLIALTGTAMFFYAENPTVRYAGCFLAKWVFGLPVSV
jgi:hypothetical protein